MIFMKQYKFCFDLDGTICYTRKQHESYLDVQPIPGAINTIQRLKKEGHYIIIMTARNMATHRNNLGKIIANQAPIVFEWLKKYEIPYDEIHFGKPLADFYIDDKAIRLENWESLNQTISSLTNNAKS